MRDFDDETSFYNASTLKNDSMSKVMILTYLSIKGTSLIMSLINFIENSVLIDVPPMTIYV